MLPGLLVALVLSLPFLYVLARKPVLRRLALRNASRRPREAALVVLGSLLGAAIVTGSFVVGDTIDGSIRQSARAHLGPIDELAVVQDTSEWSVLRQQLQFLPRDEVDGVLPFAALNASVVTSARGVLRSAPASQVVAVDFAAARKFGRDPASTGISGPTPPVDHAAITTDLADKLGARIGDLVDVYAYGRSTALFVDRVLPRRGIAGFSISGQTDAYNVLVSPETFRVVTGPSLWPSSQAYAPPSYVVAVSNSGGIEDGAKLTKSVDRQIASLVGPGTQLFDVKQSALDTADSVGKSFRDMFTGMGAFGVLAGVLLLVNLFVMLAAERKAELGMARAVGMKRSALVGAFATEGWLYALVSAAVGALVGIGLGRLIVIASEWAFKSEHNQLELTFMVKGSSIGSGFAIGFVVALVTVVATSVRVARLNIIRAIRDLPEPGIRKVKLRWVVVGALTTLLGAVWALQAFPDGQDMGLLLAPVLIVAGLVPLLGRLISPKAALGIGAAASLVWEVLVFGVYNSSFEGSGIAVFIVQGIVLTASAVILLSLLQERIIDVLRLFRVGRRLSLRLGLAYPLARRSRTGMTVAMYALVVFILTFITTLSYLIHRDVGPQTRNVSGGYTVIVDSTAANPLSPRVIEKLPGVRVVAGLYPALADFTPPGGEQQGWRLTAFDSDFVNHGPPKLTDRGSYLTDFEAWSDVLLHPNLAIVDAAFLQEGGGPAAYKVAIGDKVRVADPFSGRSRMVRIAAISVTDGLIQNGAFMGVPGARELFGTRLVPTRTYVALEPGVPADQWAASVQGRYVANGAQASSLRGLMDETYAMTNRMFQLFEGYLAMGLVVGVAGLAVVMVRAVRERRRQIGTLRAIGFQPRGIGTSFAIEAGFIALEGTLLGVTLSLVTLYNIVSRSEAMGEYRGFSVPVVTLVLLLLGTVAASLLATIGPAISASRIKPAVALRIAD
ncbi:MAG: ABC transporter permease [Gaiellaceae bacterium]